MSYSKLNGEQAVVLSIYKGSTSGTNEVSRNINKAIRELEERNSGTKVLILMDQGEYISIIVNDLLRSMLLGALLAIIILAIFLRDIRPTFLVSSRKRYGGSARGCSGREAGGGRDHGFHAHDDLRIFPDGLYDRDG